MARLSPVALHCGQPWRKQHGLCSVVTVRKSKRLAAGAPGYGKAQRVEKNF